MSTNTFFNVCPHCGFESEDDAICRACGRLYDEGLPQRDVSVFEVLSSSISMNPNKRISENLRKIFFVDPSDDPGYAHLPGNSYHEIWYGNDK